MNGKFDPKAISKMMMQGYVAKARPLDEVTHVNGKVALVTGGTSGLGFCTALRLLQGGAKVVAASWSEEEAATALPLFGQAGFGEDSVRFFKCDVTSEESVEAAVAFTAETFGSLDILVTSAGVWSYAHIYDMPEEEFLRVINVNLNSQFTLAREFGKDMVARGWGKIVFTCSLLTFQGGITVPGYAASKGAVGQLVKALANEWSSKGVNVNGIAPGYIATDNTAALRADPVRSRQILERIPAGRWGEASDIAGACVFLCSPAAAYIHGAIIPVDGGWLAR